ncbi:exonuclease domain-containing protein [Flavobacterium sp.]|uniref:exonuclease domain-containing protein n=1 Tax=Flavobacterium sp. TaxID=239 RepID=UPI002604906F|nr:exonuclease domain-containing protein [Flavobacterium sp.]
MKNQQYAIVDIETTGGNASHSRITEIAIIIHDGEQIIDRYETLINPQKEIPAPIFALTGINNEMVKKAPIFEEVAETILNLLTDRIFVAHNVNFDYSFVRHELASSGFKWKATKLCTVRAARKIRPGLLSYSLGKLCRYLEIPLVNQHRAGGDADATAILFSKLLEWDYDNEIDKMLKRATKEQQLPPNLPKEDFEQLPEKPGVYYFYNQVKKVIYVGKAINIKKRVASHFSGNPTNAQRQHFLRDIHSISFEVCATEFMALLLEGTEIKKLWPLYNRALKKYEPKYGLFEYEARNGYKYLAIKKLLQGQTPVETYGKLYDAIKELSHLVQQFQIDTRFCNFAQKTTTETIQFTLEETIATAEEHNTRVNQALAYLSASKETYAIIDHGRTNEEKSCIWVEKGHFFGMGYIPMDQTITDVTELKEQVTRYKSDPYLMKLITQYVDKHPRKVQRIEAQVD